MGTGLDRSFDEAWPLSRPFHEREGRSHGKASWARVGNDLSID